MGLGLTCGCCRFTCCLWFDVFAAAWVVGFDADGGLHWLAGFWCWVGWVGFWCLILVGFALVVGC